MLKKAPMKFDKELFKGTVLNNIKTLYRRTLEEATEQQIFQAVSYAIKDVVVDNWMATQKEYEKKDPKIVYYMSMEFLMGRALGNNLINLRAYKEVAEALDELITNLKGQGYEIVPVSELIYRDGYHMNAEGRQIKDS